jgi:uridine kinase
VTDRSEIIHQICQAILEIRLDHPLRVGIDGVDTSGKTNLADELAAELTISGRPIIRSSIDRFHNPRELRYTLGPLSPEGYYRDSFNLAVLRRYLLDPLGACRSQRISIGYFDVRSDTLLPGELVDIPPEAILLFDGIFLHRPELLDAWDFSIFIKVSFETLIRRAIERDRHIFGSADAVINRYQLRYVPAQRTYLDSIHPQEIANIVLENDDIVHPAILKNSPTQRK